MTELTVESGVQGVIYALHAGDHNYRYIGLSTEPAKRLTRHKNRALSGHNLPVCDWIRKYGPDNIKMEILESFDESTIGQMAQREIELIKEYGTYFHDDNGGLNYTTGGEGTNGHRMSEEEKTRRSELMKNSIGLFTGRMHTDESKEKMRQKKLGRVLSEETKKAIGDANKGKVISEEHRQVLSEKQKGKTNKGHHTRWCVNAGRPRPDCTFCAEA